MTLTVATPGPDAITVLANGVQIIRCAEYVGAARGTLSVVSDSLSVAGTVVKDEQSLAPPSTFTSNFSSMADSVTLTLADLTLPVDSSYTMFLGLRSDGSTPSNGRAGEFWNYYSNDIGPTVERGFDGSPSAGTNRVPTSIYEHYSLLAIGGINDNTPGAFTNMNIRAWGLTNVSDPIAWYLDVIYLVPFGLADTDESGDFSYGAFSYFLSQTLTDPSWPATDQVENDIGQFSVLYNLADGLYLFGEGMDIQEEGDAEDTEEDWHDIFFDDPEREVSWVTIVGAGSRLIKPQTLDSINFSDTTGTPQWGEYQTPNAYILSGQGSSIDSTGWAAVSGTWKFTGPGIGPPAGHNFYYDWALGQRRTGLTGTFVSTDPRTYSKVMGNLESFVLTMKCTLTSGYPSGGDIAFAAGAVRLTPFVPRYQQGLVLRFTTGGTVQASLASRYTNNESPPWVMETSGAGPTTVLGALGAGGSFWIKVERRFYHWRAKVWMDGDAEPGSWLLEAHEGIVFDDGSIYRYPYLTLTASNSEGFPVTMPIDSVIFGSPWTPGGELVLYDGWNSYGSNFAVDDITVEYDPDPAPGGAGTYTGAYFHLEKFDNSVDWGTAYVPPGALQVLYTDYAAHHFDGTDAWGTDVHGGNFRAWKEPGGKLLQAAAYSAFYFRRPARVPQWGDLKFP